MSKLSRKPEYRDANYSWEKLDNLLKANFKGPGKNVAVISLEDYDIPKDEIISEATKQGYKVTESSPGHLKFE